MKRQLDKIRNRPDEEKRKIGLFAAICVTAVVIALWALFLAIDREKQKVLNQNQELDNETQQSNPVEFIGNLIQGGRAELEQIRANSPENSDELLETLEKSFADDNPNLIDPNTQSPTSNQISNQEPLIESNQNEL